ncbi:UNKNOWN [Stylonychia lemnae]|uniref:Transmembrane protein 198 n=1 Tax=Stylonychia lemnae TaxID=5949 RepID=A0A077ZXG3_STYLE|nr:UNKNOWN [Stylonychia lemnae]|eukprot:CDW74601.1 UNKNOWN [Stylonychia lemnae]
MRILNFLLLTSSLTVLSPILAKRGAKQASDSELLKLSCLVYDDLSFYDLRGLESEQSDYSFISSNSKHNYYFNLCAFTNKACGEDTTQAFGIRVDQNNQCTKLTGNNLQSLNTSVEEYSDGERYVQLKFAGGDKCKEAGATNPEAKYSMTLKLECKADGKKEAPLNIKTVEVTDKCAPIITASHKNACPVFSSTTFTRFFVDRPYILGPIAIIFGILVSFQGRKFFPWTIGVIGCFIGGGITLLLFSMSSILDSIQSSQATDQSTFFAILTFIVAGIIGIFVGFILQKMLHIGAAILGAIGGFFIGVAAYNIIFFSLKSEILLTSCSILGSLIMAFLSFRQYDNIVIFGTGFIGSYSFTRGISLFIGNFPNEILFFTQLIEGNVSATWETYFYLAIFVILFILGVVYQRRIRVQDAQNNYIKF